MPPFKGWKGLRLDTSPAGLERRTCLDAQPTPSGLLSVSAFMAMCSLCTDTSGAEEYRLLWVPPYGLRLLCSDCCKARDADADKRATCKPGQNVSTSTGTVSSIRP
jgi:hypothetical protein